MTISDILEIYLIYLIYLYFQNLKNIFIYLSQKAKNISGYIFLQGCVLCVTTYYYYTVTGYWLLLSYTRTLVTTVVFCCFITRRMITNHNDYKQTLAKRSQITRRTIRRMLSSTINIGINHVNKLQELQLQCYSRSR
jgi:hypothetical protein